MAAAALGVVSLGSKLKDNDTYDTSLHMGRIPRVQAYGRANGGYVAKCHKCHAAARGSPVPAGSRSKTGQTVNSRAHSLIGKRDQTDVAKVDHICCGQPSLSIAEPLVRLSHDCQCSRIVLINHRRNRGWL